VRQGCTRFCGPKAQSGYVRRLQWHMAQLPESADEDDWEEADLDETPVNDEDTAPCPTARPAPGSS